MFTRRRTDIDITITADPSTNDETQSPTQRWKMGMLNVPDTEDVPGSIQLLLPPGSLEANDARPEDITAIRDDKKRDRTGRFVLDPQPSTSPNDPLTWPVWRRDLALLAIGLYSLLGGGMMPVLAAGFGSIAETFDVSVPTVAQTTTVYLLGLAVGNVLLAPTAVLFGKRPVYLFTAVAFVGTAIWSACATSFPSLMAARVAMGLAVSSVECLPGASVAELYYLHEKTYRLGIYTLLLLGGKNIVPLASAAVIEAHGWRWACWVVAMVVGGIGLLLFLGVPETFWSREEKLLPQDGVEVVVGRSLSDASTEVGDVTGNVAPDGEKKVEEKMDSADIVAALDANNEWLTRTTTLVDGLASDDKQLAVRHVASHATISSSATLQLQSNLPDTNSYTQKLASQPARSFLERLHPLPGRLSREKWHHVALRPFILFTYPNILWSALSYSLACSWLIVLSESVTTIYENRASYDFTPLQAGLVYLSPFIGGILGTAIAGKCSDIIVLALTRRNGGVFEPEFRLLMAAPSALALATGLFGYGWSASDNDAWIAPTICFGLVGFGASLAATVSMAYALDCHRGGGRGGAAPESILVAVNLAKNSLGLVFSIFFAAWLVRDGSREVFAALAGLHVAAMLTTIPMYVYGKRVRAWTARRRRRLPRGQ